MMPERPGNHLPESILQAFLDGMAGPEGSSAVQVHLVECPACRERLDVLRALFSRLEGLPDVSLACDLRPAVMRGIHGRALASKRLRLALTAQAAAAVALVAWLWASAGPLIERLVAEPLHSQMMALRETLAGPVPAAWADLLAEMQLWFTRAVWLTGLPLDYAPVIPEWGVLVTAAGVLWLTINGYALRAIALERRRRAGGRTKIAR
jgi:anti-sigma factor RsiW